MLEKKEGRKEQREKGMEEGREEGKGIGNDKYERKLVIRSYAEMQVSIS